ncbi:hypothetical protein Cgig2_020058 [Carnegiea gigantea]|uniref:Uncharacterized protein n=1 Tax=Carnegiea gigantea TaxID=171969 RepID=A0A9Q1QGT0_9CARY|nr:hypothetical protein Cgig2_020058 [Carnegiea gigantea]
MEVMPPLPPSPPSLNLEAINTDSNCWTPFMSAPSSPQRPFNLFFCSAPTSPRSSSSFINGGRDDVDESSSSAFVPCDWKFEAGGQKPSVGDEGFEFDFSGQLDMMIEPSLSSADELFAGGKIRPWKPPPPPISAVDSSNPPSCPSPISERRKSFDDEKDPFEAALKNTSQPKSEIARKFQAGEQNRGRSSNIPQNLRSNSRKKGMSRSLSPLRVSEFPLQTHQNPNRSSNNGGNSSSSKGVSRKWRLKDLLLFRSASEGTATTTGKDPLRKYFSISTAAKKIEEGGKNCESFRSVASSSCSSMADVGPVSRRRGKVSAHELHYTANRSVAGEMKWKTSLPYKHGFLGCLALGFNPAFNDVSKAFKPFAS